MGKYRSMAVSIVGIATLLSVAAPIGPRVTSDFSGYGSELGAVSFAIF